MIVIAGLQKRESPYASMGMPDSLGRLHCPLALAEHFVAPALW